MTGESVLGWLVETGWRLELAGSGGAVRGTAWRRLDGELQAVSAGAESVEALAWALLDAAATTLEAVAERQEVTAAA